MMALAGYELYPKDAENSLEVLALAVNGLVDQGVEVDEAYDSIFGAGRFDKMQDNCKERVNDFETSAERI